MKIHLEPFQDIDLKLLALWKQQIDSDLYMSRTTPKKFNGKTTKNDDLWRWYTIICDGFTAGTIWIEKEYPESQKGRLGILLCAEQYFNKGIGRISIMEAIKASKVDMGIDSILLRVRIDNSRAIACYQNCGFKITREGEKLSNRGQLVRFFEMQV